MESRRMEIILISARDLNPIMFTKSKAYAVAWISNELKNRQWTPVDEENGTNPTWNQVMNFNLDEAALQQGRLLLEIEIYTDSTFGEKEIGRVSVPLNEFLKPAGSNKGVSDSAQFVSYQVRKPGGKGKGVLNLSIKLAENVDFKQQQQQQPLKAVTRSFVPTEAEPVVAYPVNPSAGSSSESPPYSPDTNQYPPPSYTPQAGYPPPPPDHQGYPPPHYQGYPPPPPHQQGYPPPPPPPHRQGYPPPHHQGHFPPPPPPHYQGHFPPPPPHHRGYPLY